MDDRGRIVVSYEKDAKEITRFSCTGKRCLAEWGKLPSPKVITEVELML